jgi:carbon monoxide dehydrogenase subunit G
MQKGPTMLAFEGDRDFTLPPAEVWAKLSDPRFLVVCIPDVETVKSVTESQADVVLRPGLAFVRGTLDASIRVLQAASPNSIHMAIHGKGIGSSSYVEAKLGLAPLDTGTKVHWIVEIKELGGLLKMVPTGLIRGAAEKVVNDAWNAVVTKLS